MDTQDINRNTTQDRNRFRAWLSVLVMVFVLDQTLGFNLELDRITFLQEQSDHWAAADYAYGQDDEFLIAKPPGVTRILYLSNSHAFTGGHVPKHLQSFLDGIAPGQFEVINLAEPGIFAPEMLQRGLRALDYDVDVAILGLNYINFSDRMRLNLQAHSTRSFFNNGIFHRLPAGFWARNYDLGLYNAVFTEKISKLYRNRNALRNTWEVPLANMLKNLCGDSRQVFFLEMEQSERWRFPDGYDNNLFQWNLYAAGRDNHLKEIEHLIESYNENQIPIIAANLPIDFEKSLYESTEEDLALYREQLKNLSHELNDYADYQENFPARFSTYDALHPTWHGARLHAFDFLLRLHAKGYIPQTSEQDLLEVFSTSDTAVSQDYQIQLTSIPPHETPTSFKRYDPSEPENARELLSHLLAVNPGTQLHTIHLLKLAKVIRYWTEGSFYNEVNENIQGTLFEQAIQIEMASANERMLYFRNALEIQETARLQNLGNNDETGMIEINQREMESEGLEFDAVIYRLTNETTLAVLSKEGKVFAKGYQLPDGSGYYLIDLLGNGSFIQASPIDRLFFPDWLYEGPPLPDWGI